MRMGFLPSSYRVKTEYVLPSSTGVTLQLVCGDLLTVKSPPHHPQVLLTFLCPVVSQLLMANMELISQMRFRSWSMICLSCWFFCLSFCREDRRQRGWLREFHKSGASQDSSSSLGPVFATDLLFSAWQRPHLNFWFLFVGSTQMQPWPECVWVCVPVLSSHTQISVHCRAVGLIYFTILQWITASRCSHHSNSYSAWFLPAQLIHLLLLFR